MNQNPPDLQSPADSLSQGTALNGHFGDTQYRIDFKAEGMRDFSILFKEIARGAQDISEAFTTAEAKWPLEYQQQRVFWGKLSFQV